MVVNAQAKKSRDTFVLIVEDFHDKNDNYVGKAKFQTFFSNLLASDKHVFVYFLFK